MKSMTGVIGLILGLALFFVVNIVGWNVLPGSQWDLTEQKLHTLSDGTKNIVGRLEEPVTLRFFFSRGLVNDFPQLETYGRQVEEKLKEYESHSDGKLRLEIIEPEPFSEEEDRAVSYGLSGPAINASGDRLYFGLVGTNSVDAEEVIPFFDERREEFLEYDLTQLVDNLSNLTSKKVVGLMSSLPLRGGAMNPMNPQAPTAPAWVIISQIEAAGFEVRDLAPADTTEIDPEEIDMLMLVHPKDLSEATRFAIDQYALSGGKVLAFVDPFSQQEQPPPGGNPMMADRGSKLEDLFSSWGVELVSSKLAGDRKNANKIPDQRGGAIDFPLFPSLRSENMDSSDVVTSQLDTINAIMPGILKATANASTTLTPLIKTSSDAMQIDVMQVQFMQDPSSILQSFISGEEELTIAARVQGPIKSAFPGGKPASADDADAFEEEEDPFANMLDGEEPDATADAGSDSEAASEPSIQEGQLNAIIVADTDILHDNAWVRVTPFFGQNLLQPLADNADFVVNAIDNLCGSDDLISLRSRGSARREFTKKLELERDADERFRAEESMLEARLQETEKKLNELQFTEDSTGRMILSAEQQAELDQFRVEQVDTRKKLRNVRHQLQKDIDALGTKMKLANIALLPGLISLTALLFFLMRLVSPKRD
ncbi:MAG: ABC-type uncharacterized transport system involved in gliding motility auxiliary subunit [Planctomycetota bacterium]|jgi:ABC-type uncharacterized transport system involved in gliding motility auxiliary subunit